MSDKKDSMEIDNRIESNGATCGIEVNGSALPPVSLNASGEGLPYAPINWPNPGDNWRWKVGRRTAISGYFMDRYLYTPSSFQNDKSKKRSFASRLSVEQYIRKEFPGTDVNAFFASFSWKIPSTNMPSAKGDEVGYYPEEMAEYSESDSQSDTVRCKAGNKMCNSLVVEGRESLLAAMPCDLCCSEPGFCRDCCCILCCKTVNSVYGGYSYIKCEAMQSEGYICAHLAHIDCALRTYMAGTVGGSIALDAAYHCRRCDARTDLVSHVTRSIQACESIDSRDDIEIILNVGICILRNSHRETAKRLLDRIESARSKLQSATYIEDIWKVEDDIAAISTGAADHGDTLEVTDHHDPLELKTGSQEMKSTSSDYQIQPVDLEDEIYDVLEALKKSQESEYKMAEDVLNTQKNYLLNLYEQLHKERSELTNRTSSAAPDALLEAILNRMNQIKRELNKLRDMEEVAKGFGKTSKVTPKVSVPEGRVEKVDKVVFVEGSPPEIKDILTDEAIFALSSHPPKLYCSILPRVFQAQFLDDQDDWLESEEAASEERTPLIDQAASSRSAHTTSERTVIVSSDHEQAYLKERQQSRDQSSTFAPSPHQAITKTPMDRTRKASRFNASAPTRQTPPPPPVKAAPIIPPPSKRQKVTTEVPPPPPKKLPGVVIRKSRAPSKDQNDPRAKDKGVAVVGKKGSKRQAEDEAQDVDPAAEEPWVIKPFRKDGTQLGKDASVFKDKETCLTIARSITSPADEEKLANNDPDTTVDITSALLVKALTCHMGTVKAYEDLKAQIDITVAMQTEIDALKESESKLKGDKQALQTHLSIIEREGRSASTELQETKRKLKRAMDNYERLDAKCPKFRREIAEAQADLLNVREDLSEAREKVEHDLEVVDQFWALQMDVTNCEAYRMGWQERDKPEGQRVTPDEADSQRGITTGVYVYKELRNGVIVDQVAEEIATDTVADPSVTIVRTELPLVKPLPLNCTVESGETSRSLS